MMSVSSCSTEGSSKNLDSESFSDFARSPASHSLIAFEERESVSLLKSCWYAGYMAPREDKHIITGNKDADSYPEQQLLLRCFWHGALAGSSIKSEPGAAEGALLAKCLSAGLCEEVKHRRNVL